MLFCPKCKSLLKPKFEKNKKVMTCSCGYSSEGGSTAVSEKVKTHKEIQVVEEIETKPLVDARCAKCAHGKAYFWSIQTRSSDEPETRFFKCEKCKHVWREYK